MKEFRKDFMLAVEDYRHLLSRKYPQKTVHSLVSTRYSLSAEERSILFRGINISQGSTDNIKSEVKDQDLHIDTWNVIFTIRSYLLGLTVYVGDDGILRDTAEAHQAPRPDDILTRAITLLAEYLIEDTPGKISFYLDDKMGGKEFLSNVISSVFYKEELPVEYHLSASVDKDLTVVHDGYVASSDSQVISMTSAKLIDLPRQILEKRFNASFPDTRKI